MEAAWTELQDELNYLSDHSTHIIAENSGHVIHLDEPELVVDAIHDVLNYVEKELEEQGGGLPKTIATTIHILLGPELMNSGLLISG